MRFWIGIALGVFSISVFGQVQIDEPWIRATPPGAKTAAGYMTIRNKAAQPERLLGGSSPAGKVETHVNIKDGDVVRMREVKGYDIPAKGVFELKPGGAHLMLVDLKGPLKEGDKVPLVLKFEKAGEVKVDFQVRPLAGGSPEHKH